MRCVLAALALAGALAAVCSPSLAAMAGDVVRALPPDREVRAIVNAAALAEGVSPRVALAVAKVESGFNPRLRGAHGEYGLFQIKCQTARGLGFRGVCGALADPRINAHWGVRHVRLALARGAVCFHQAGLGAKRCSARYTALIMAAERTFH